MRYGLPVKRGRKPKQTTTPKRAPKTEAGKRIFNAIVQSAEQLLVAEGVELTTNAIAERAGVSVGSLYQYFPNKLAVIATVTKRLNAQLEEAMAAAVEEQGSAGDALIACLRAYCRTGDPHLRRALLRHVPRSWEGTGLDDGEERVLRRLQKLGSGVGIDPLQAQLFVFAIRGAFQGSLLFSLESVVNGHVEKQLEELLKAYLARHS